MIDLFFNELLSRELGDCWRCPDGLGYPEGPHGTVRGSAVRHGLRREDTDRNRGVVRGSSQRWHISVRCEHTFVMKSASY